MNTPRYTVVIGALEVRCSTPADVLALERDFSERRSHHGRSVEHANGIAAAIGTLRGKARRYLELLATHRNGLTDIELAPDLELKGPKAIWAIITTCKAAFGRAGCDFSDVIERARKTNGVEASWFQRIKPTAYKQVKEGLEMS